MNVFTLRPCASARKYVVLGVVRLTGVGTVISRSDCPKGTAALTLQSFREYRRFTPDSFHSLPLRRDSEASTHCRAAAAAWQ